MFGRNARTNAIPDSGFVDGSTDPTSSAFSPVVTPHITALRPVVQEQFQAHNVRTQASFTTGAWDHSFQSPAHYINQDVGGQSGNAAVLGWTTGLRPRKESRTPLTGRVLVMNNMGVHPVVGTVGRDNRANRLLSAVETQSSDFQPFTTAEIARQFTGRRIQLEDNA